MFEKINAEQLIHVEHLKNMERAKKLTVLRSTTYDLEKNLASFQSFTREDIADKGVNVWTNWYTQERSALNKAYRKLYEVENFIKLDRDQVLEKVNSPKELLETALWEIKEYGFDTMASFPIFSGVNMTPLEKIANAKHYINALSSRGYMVWSQVPYLNMNLPQHLSENVAFDTKEKFEEFYIPLLSSGAITNLCMHKNWENSVGCRTEHEVAKQCGVAIHYDKQ